jgi:hypothetical protein
LRCASRGRPTARARPTRYWHLLETNPSPWSDSLGFCFDYTKYQYDSDNNGTLDTTYSSCTAISPTADQNNDGTLDVVEWGCTP